MSGIIRIEKNKNYTVVSNIPANDKALSWEARGVLFYLLTKPDGWECRNQDLINQGMAGEKKIKGILGELKNAGYITRTRTKKPSGLFEWETTIHEVPVGETERTKTKPQTTIPPKPPYGEPYPPKPPYGEPPYGGGGHIVNTESVNTELVNTKVVVTSTNSQNSELGKMNGMPPVIQSFKIYSNITGITSIGKSDVNRLKSIGDKEDDLRRWESVVKAWLSCGYFERNINGMMDWFTNGIPEKKSWNNQIAPAQSKPSELPPNIDLEAYKALLAEMNSQTYNPMEDK